MKIRFIVSEPRASASGCHYESLPKGRGWEVVNRAQKAGCAALSRPASRGPEPGSLLTFFLAITITFKSRQRTMKLQGCRLWQGRAGTEARPTKLIFLETRNQLS